MRERFRHQDSAPSPARRISNRAREQSQWSYPQFRRGGRRLPSSPFPSRFAALSGKCPAPLLARHGEVVFRHGRPPSRRRKPRPACGRICLRVLPLPYRPERRAISPPRIRSCADRNNEWCVWPFLPEVAALVNRERARLIAERLPRCSNLRACKGVPSDNPRECPNDNLSVAFVK